MNSTADKLTQLPSLPAVAIRLLQTLSQADFGINDVLSLLKNDPVLSGKVLKAANSTHFGMQARVGNLNRAVVMLGKKTVTSLALCFSLSEASTRHGTHSKYYSDFWIQSFVRACSAQLIAQHFYQLDPGEAFTLGILARIGRLSKLTHTPEAYVELKKRSESSEDTLYQFEEIANGKTSTALTLEIFEDLRMPEQFKWNVLYMENARCAPSSPQDKPLANCLIIANAFADYFSGEHRFQAIMRIDRLCQTILGISESEVLDLVYEIQDSLNRNASLFDLNIEHFGSLTDLLAQSLNQLSKLIIESAFIPDTFETEALELSTENTSLRQRVLELTAKTNTDMLTKVYNRTYLIQQLQLFVHNSVQTQTPFSMLFIDIDHFKKVNDTFGHLAGDIILKNVAAAIVNAVSPGDIVTRYGGEEFVILSRLQDVDLLEELAKRICSTIQALTHEQIQPGLTVTVSLGGICTVPPDMTSETIQKLLGTADLAMYTSKNRGRNCVTVFTEMVTNLKEKTTVA